MLSARGVRNACPKCTFTSSFLSTRFYNSSAPLIRSRASLQAQLVQSNKSKAITQTFSTSRYLRQEAAAPSTHQPSPEEIEQVVRDAKQRFRDTLPKGYLSAEEYSLYERLYGPPLRETAPEDVGIDTHADMGPQPPRPDNEGVLLRELEGGEFEEIAYTIEKIEGEETDQLEQTGEALETAEPKELGYVDLVARSQREYDALQKLAQDFKESQKRQEEAEELAAEKEAQEAEESKVSHWEPEEEPWIAEEDIEQSGELKRFHPYSLEGRFHGSPVEITLPRDEFITPIRDLLERAHIDHVQKAAEDAYGGSGLPLSPSTPENRKNGHMKAVGLAPDKKHMTEIEGDAFIAGYLPPMYASVQAALREVRKRMGSDWIQAKLKKGGSGLSILDAGSGGAGLVAWDQVLKAEWEMLKENKQVRGEEPPGKKTVVVGSDRLRYRLKHFLHNTTFLPRLPDYEHSGEMRGVHLDAPETPQPRKSYDVIIASHLFLKEEQDHYRQAVLNNLWSLLSKDGGVLIVLEKAHPRGFEAVAHVRDTLLKQFLLPQSGEPDLTPEDFNPAFHREREPGYIIAPCTNHGTCPMYTTPGKGSGRKDYCHFSQRFVRPNFYSQLLGAGSNNQGEVEFSYVAFRRGMPKPSPLTGKEATSEAFTGYEKTDKKPNMHDLPRAVLPPLKRKGHITLELCTSQGTLERWTVPKSFSKLAYHDARKSRWGDLWALGAKTRVIRSVRAGKGPDDGGKRAGREGKKPRQVDVVMGPGGLSASEKNAGRERRPKNKKDRQKELLKELEMAEAEEERMIGAEIEAEVEAEVEADERRSRRRR